eukprot:scaffold178111_cov31-Tisochrysis_lutea.AAC.2
MAIHEKIVDERWSRLGELSARSRSSSRKATVRIASCVRRSALGKLLASVFVYDGGTNQHLAYQAVDEQSHVPSQRKAACGRQCRSGSYRRAPSRQDRLPPDKIGGVHRRGRHVHESPAKYRSHEANNETQVVNEQRSTKDGRPDDKGDEAREQRLAEAHEDEGERADERRGNSHARASCFDVVRRVEVVENERLTRPPKREETRQSVEQ